MADQQPKPKPTSAVTRKLVAGARGTKRANLRQRSRKREAYIRSVSY